MAKSTSTTAAATFLQWGQGQEILAGGNRIRVKAGPALGSHGISMFESLVPPGGEAFVHVHDEYEEAFYVLAGEIELRMGDQTVTGKAGASVFVPAGVVHGFTNRGRDAARLLVVHSPARALVMIEELSEVMGVGEPARVVEVLAKHKTRMVR